MNEDKLRILVSEESLKYLGKKAQVPNKKYNCFDCEQLINVIFRDLFGISIRENGFGKSSTTKVMTSSWGKFYNCEDLNKKEKIDFISNIEIGDILFFHTQSLEEKIPTLENRYPGHIALYLGDKKFIHAKASSGKVLIESFYEEDYLDIFVGYKNMVPSIIEFLKSKENSLFKR